MKIKTPSDLKHAQKEKGVETYFFSPDTMRFFGDTMRNYGIRQDRIKTNRGNEKNVYELYRKNPVKHGNQGSAYFDMETLKRVFPARESEKES